MKSTFWRIPGKYQLDCLRVIDSSHCFPRHWHETYVIEILEAGTNDFWCEGNIYSARPGDIIVIHPGEIHSGYPSRKSALSYRSIYPGKSLMIDLCRKVTKREELACFQSHIIRDSSLAFKLQKAHSLMERTDTRIPGHELMIIVLEEFIHRYSDQSHCNLKTVISSSEARIQKAVDFLSEKYHENVTLTELSNVCGLSEFHFLRIFKKYTGLAPYEYLIARRVEESRKLLSVGMPIAETAARTGFFDQSHLNRHFKRILGFTPGKYAR